MVGVQRGVNVWVGVSVRVGVIVTVEVRVLVGVLVLVGDSPRIRRGLEGLHATGHIDIGDMARRALREKGDPAFLHHLAVPGGLHEGGA